MAVDAVAVEVNQQVLSLEHFALFSLFSISLNLQALAVYTSNFGSDPSFQDDQVMSEKL